jgi:hypothetical protein
VIKEPLEEELILKEETASSSELGTDILVMRENFEYGLLPSFWLRPRKV